jgi:hypothetical protein
VTGDDFLVFQFLVGFGSGESLRGFLPCLLSLVCGLLDLSASPELSLRGVDVILAFSVNEVGDRESVLIVKFGSYLGTLLRNGRIGTSVVPFLRLSGL